MKQWTFTDIECSFRKKKTKREEFLEIMDEIIIIMQRYEREFILERKIEACLSALKIW